MDGWMERRGEGFGRRGGGVALQVQVRHKNSPFPLLCASWASIVPTLISSREEVFLQDRRRHSAAASWLICSRVLKPLLLFLQNKNCPKLQSSPVQHRTAGGLRARSETPAWTLQSTEMQP